MKILGSIMGKGKKWWLTKLCEIIVAIGEIDLYFEFFSFSLCLFLSLPEHNVLKVSFCGHPMSVVHHQHLLCGHFRGHISCSVNLEYGQNVCLGKISDKLELGSSGVINYLARSRKTF